MNKTIVFLLGFILFTGTIAPSFTIPIFAQNTVTCPNTFETIGVEYTLVAGRATATDPENNSVICTYGSEDAQHAGFSKNLWFTVGWSSIESKNADLFCHQFQKIYKKSGELQSIYSNEKIAKVSTAKTSGLNEEDVESFATRLLKEAESYAADCPYGQSKSSLENDVIIKCPEEFSGLGLVYFLDRAIPSIDDPKLMRWGCDYKTHYNWAESAGLPDRLLFTMSWVKVLGQYRYDSGCITGEQFTENLVPQVWSLEYHVFAKGPPRAESIPREEVDKILLSMVGQAEKIAYPCSLKGIPIIFLPGVAGSSLYLGEPRTVEHQNMLWPVPRGGVANLLHDLDGSTTHNIVADRIFDFVPHPDAQQLNFYGSLTEKISYTSNYTKGKNLHDFPYDWRLDLDLTIKKLDKFVDAHRDVTKREKVILISHSMGGLISRAYANTIGADKVDKIITIGSPFGGTPKPFYAMVMGYNFGNPLVHSSVVKKLGNEGAMAIYQLMPRTDFVSDPDKIKLLDRHEVYQNLWYKNLEDKITDPYTTIKHKGIEYDIAYARDHYKTIPKNTLQIDMNLVKKSDEFYSKYIGTAEKPKPLPSGIEHYAIIGTGVKTLDRYLMEYFSLDPKILEYKKDGKKVGLEMIPKYGDGDGTVPKSSAEATTPANTRYYIKHSGDASTTHGSLANNPTIQNIVLEIILDNPPPTNKFTFQKSFERYDPETDGYASMVMGYDFFLHSDAHLSVIDEKTGKILGFNNRGLLEETLAGTFLVMDEKEYASVAEGPYKVEVNGIRTGEFTLDVISTNSDGVTSFSYVGVPTQEGSSAEFQLPSELTQSSIPKMNIDTNGQIQTIQAENIETEKTTPPPEDSFEKETDLGQDLVEKGTQGAQDALERGTEVGQIVTEKGAEAGQAVIEKGSEAIQEISDGGCLIATATYGSELAPQVQQLRELRDNKLLQTESGTSFMQGFNDFYYSFSPMIADYERENPVFKSVVKTTITPLITSLSLLNHVSMDSEAEVLGYGISLILLNVGMYVGIPAIAVIGIRKKF